MVEVLRVQPFSQKRVDSYLRLSIPLVLCQSPSSQLMRQIMSGLGDRCKTWRCWSTHGV